jgi:hypothetical protein
MPSNELVDNSKEARSTKSGVRSKMWVLLFLSIILILFHAFSSDFRLPTPVFHP